MCFVFLIPPPPPTSTEKVHNWIGNYCVDGIVYYNLVLSIFKTVEHKTNLPSHDKLPDFSLPPSYYLFHFWLDVWDVECRVSRFILTCLEEFQFSFFLSIVASQNPLTSSSASHTTAPYKWVASNLFKYLQILNCFIWVATYLPVKCISSFIFCYFAHFR